MARLAKLPCVVLIEEQEMQLSVPVGQGRVSMLIR